MEGWKVEQGEEWSNWELEEVLFRLRAGTSLLPQKFWLRHPLLPDRTEQAFLPLPNSPQIYHYPLTVCQERRPRHLLPRELLMVTSTGARTRPQRRLDR